MIKSAICAVIKNYLKTTETIKSAILAAVFTNDLKTTETNKSAIRDAVLKNDLKTTRKLLKAGVDINDANENGVTALHIAVLNQFKAITNLLMKNGADSTLKDCTGNTPIHFAIMSRNYKLMKEMVSKVSDINTLATVLQFALQQPRDNCFAMLIEEVKDRNDNCFRETLLHECARNNQVEVLEVLLRQKFDVNAKNIDGFTPLHIAAQFGRLDAVKMLAKCGADLNSTDCNRITPLIMATMYEFDDIVDFILHFSLDARKNLKYIKFTYSVAQQIGCDETIKSFLSYANRVRQIRLTNLCNNVAWQKSFNEAIRSGKRETIAEQVILYETILEMDILEEVKMNLI